MTIYEQSLWDPQQWEYDDPPDDWDDAEGQSYQDDVWDVFELDDWEDPQPQFGDFWPQLDDEEEI